MPFVTKEDITAILLLLRTAVQILDSLPEGAKVDKFKSQFPAILYVAAAVLLLMSIAVMDIPYGSQR